MRKQQKLQIKEGQATMDLEQMICSICLAAQENPMKLEKCVHSFCTDCISQWLDIKNNCPLCLNLIGNTQYNKLMIKPPEQVEFDSSALVFQNELKSIDETMKNLNNRINKKHQQSKNLKCHFPKSSLTYISDQMLVTRNYYSCLEESILINDSVNVSMYMQLVTEVLLDIENVLEGGEPGRMHDDYDEGDYSEDEEEGTYSDEDLEDYLHCQNARKEKARQKKSAVQTVGNNSQAKSGKIIKM